MKAAVALAVLLACLAGRARADVSVSADVDKTAVTLDEQVVLSVTVSGSEASLPDPQIPPMPNFSVYSSGRNQQISFINGQVQSSIVHTFVLQPRFVGKAVIPPIAVSYQGKTSRTQPIPIEVERPGAGPSPARPGAPSRAQLPGVAPPERRGGGAGGPPDLFVTAQVDKKDAYVNEQVTLTVRFYTAVSLLGNPQYIAPKLSGFIAEDLPPERHGQAAVRGRPYYFSEIKTALFPVQPGRLEIGRATVRAQVQGQVNVDPFSPDFFDKFFSQGLVQPINRDVSSEPLLVQARALPEAGKPADFSGAVGSFRISAAVDRDRAKVGDAVNLVVTVEGVGSLKTAGDPAMPDLKDFRVFDTVSSVNVDKRNDVVSGSKVFKTVLVPRVSGSLTIPPVRFSYFDAAKRAYVTAQTTPLSIQVAPGEPGAAPAGPGPAPAAQGLANVSQDIRYLMTASPRRPVSRALGALADAGPINAAPVAVFLLALGFSGAKRLGELDPARRRRRAALKAALGRADAAQKQADPRQAAAALADAFTGYLADKLLVSPAGLTARRAQEGLKTLKPGLAEFLLERVRATWDELDERRFAPAGGSVAAAQTAGELRELLKLLDKELEA